MFTIASKYKEIESQIKDSFDNFEKKGEWFIKGSRNAIKIFNINNQEVNIKSFKKPSLINKIAYRFFRKSKARRSYEYATILIENGIGTPKPIAFQENFDAIGLTNSFYACEHLICDLTFRDITTTDNYPDSENILRQFTQFTYSLHEKNIEFIDHSPGNTLIVNQGNGKYSFYLVDLNRTNFNKKMNFEVRMKNFSKLTKRKDIVEIMSNEYAKISGENKEKVLNAMWNATEEFQQKFQRKKKLKKKLKFWKK